jgi:hypothetical protein
VCVCVCVCLIALLTSENVPSPFLLSSRYSVQSQPSPSASSNRRTQQEQAQREKVRQQEELESGASAQPGSASSQMLHPAHPTDRTEQHPRSPVRKLTLAQRNSHGDRVHGALRIGVGLRNEMWSSAAPWALFVFSPVAKRNARNNFLGK